MSRGNDHGDLGAALTDLNGAKSGMSQGEALAKHHKMGVGLLNDRIIALFLIMTTVGSFVFVSLAVGWFMLFFWIITIPTYYWLRKRRLNRIREQHIEELRSSAEDII